MRSLQTSKIITKKVRPSREPELIDLSRADKPFDEQFKKHTSAIASGVCSYGEIPREQWGDHGSWIDEDKAAKVREDMRNKNVIYGDSVSYREMCTLDGSCCISLSTILLIRVCLS